MLWEFVEICSWSCCDKVVIYVWNVSEMKSIALNFVRWFLKNNSCDLLNEVVIRCEIVATNYLYSFIWRNFMIKYCIIICWMNVVNECVEWICWWNMWWKCVEELLWWSCDEVAMKLWWSCDEVVMKFYIKIVVMKFYIKIVVMKFCHLIIVMKLWWSSVT